MINLLIFLSIFASIILIFYIYSNLLLHSIYYCIVKCFSRVSNIYRDKTIIRTQQQQQHQTVGNINQFSLYFCTHLQLYYFFVLCIATFDSLSLLFYYNISVTFIDIGLHNITIYQQQEQHKVSTVYLLMAYFTVCSTFFKTL